MGAREKPGFWNPSVRAERSLAVVACNGARQGAVLHYIGRGITMMIEGEGWCDLSDLGLDDCPKGVWVWDGRYVWSCSPATVSAPEEHSLEAVGVWRELTCLEWSDLREGSDPFASMRCMHSDEDGDCPGVEAWASLCAVHAPSVEQR